MLNGGDVSSKMQRLLSMYISGNIPIKTSNGENITDVILEGNTIVLVIETKTNI